MGIKTKCYIFETPTNDELLNKFKSLTNLKIESTSLSKFDKNIKTRNGYIVVLYKNVLNKIFVSFHKDCVNYTLLTNYNKGFCKVKSKITNYGECKNYLLLSIEPSIVSVSLMKEILKVFGGVLIPNDCGNLCRYISIVN